MHQSFAKSNNFKNSSGNFGLYRPELDQDSCGVGFIVDKFGTKSHQIVIDAVQILKNLEHRGALGEDHLAGDGAGIMTQIPHDLFKKVTKPLGFDLPDAGEYAVGVVFLPNSPKSATALKELISQVLSAERLQLLGWRTVPTDNSCLSKKMLAMEPVIEQFFVKSNNKHSETLERNLYIARRVIENRVEGGTFRAKHFFNIPSFSARQIVYKGMLMATQLEKYFHDIKDPDFTSSLAVVHQRYSTNTFPSWGLAQPFRFAAHNGEINTLRGNVNWSNARECQHSSDLFGVRLKKIFPVITPNYSDSSAFDNTLEFLTMAGRAIEHVAMLMMPQAWENDQRLDPGLKNFYTYSSSLLEPWDGPAAIVFCDGEKVGAILDRNGLRPARYLETTDGRLILASEAGVLDIPSAKIKSKGRLGPGQIIMADTNQGQIFYDREIKMNIAKQYPYHRWVEEQVITLNDLPAPAAKTLPDTKEIRFRQLVFGYTSEQISLLLKPMAEKGMEAVYAMGTDTPLAVLSKLPKTIYHYFKQSFAQVTNPAIDSIREEVVMSLNSIVGGGYNILEDNPKNCHMLVIPQPILTNSELEQLRNCHIGSFRSCEISICYPLYEVSLAQAMVALCQEAEDKVDEGYRLLVLSDRDFSEVSAPIPALLAVAGLHHYLIRANKRGKVGLIIETGEAREVHDFACLIGYGAGAINPYLAFETISEMAIENHIQDIDRYEAQENYIKAIQAGLKKIFAKMGISTLLGYQAAQIFEAVGLNSSLVDQYFTGTASSIEGVGLKELGEDIISRHKLAYRKKQRGATELLTGGEYNWRAQGEFHVYNPTTVHLLQQAAWRGDQKLYDEFKSIANNRSENTWSIRSLLDFNYQKRPKVPLSEVEPASDILKRFCGGAMSIGAISKEAHETIAIALNDLGARSNTGEGGEEESRFKVSPDGKLRRSAIKQVASGRFGVTSNYLINADELQIKIAQGAKPGEGGQLWGGKIDAYIAMLRHTVLGVTLISPPPHHDIYSIEDLSQLIFDLKNANPNANVSVKLVAASGIGAVAAGVSKAKADGIIISGYDGGTGASPATSIKHAGAPWEIGLVESQQALVANNLRSKVKLQVDGHIKTGRDVVIAALLGADELGFATSLLITTGCIMMRKCHLNTCPVGIATQNEELRRKYHGKAEYIKNYLQFVAGDVREIMAELGYRKFEDMIGQSDSLLVDEDLIAKRKLNIDLTKLLTKVPSKSMSYRNSARQDDLLKDVLDRTLIKQAAAALASQKPVHLQQMIIKNSNRTVGTILGSEISRLYGSKGLPEDTIKIDFVGTAGQSFGAFIPQGLSLKVTGDANDYVGKGLSGGKIVICPPSDAIYEASKTTIVGNTCLYGATSGRAFFSGLAGQRFAVRNSGCSAVVEGVGDHGCEYMTGGRVVILGKTGKNFAAGMSGGIAYVYDPWHNLKRNCNRSMVEIEQLVTSAYSEELKSLLEEHHRLTGSSLAAMILRNFYKKLADFVMVIPFEYRKVLAA